MKRTLFGYEFRSALVPNLVTVGAALGTLTLFERLYGPRFGLPGDLASVGNLTLVVGLVLFGFISGEKCFSSAMKEHRMLFLASLPIPRNRVWLAIVSARLLAALISLVAVVAIRWPWLHQGAMSSLAIDGRIALGTFCYIPLFSAGACFALLFRRPLVVLAVGCPLFGFLCVEILAASSYARSRFDPHDLWVMPVDLGGVHAVVFFWFSLVLLSIMFLSLSRWLFVRGEIGDLRRRTKNQILSGAAMVACITFILSMATSERLFSIHDTWVIRDCKVSPDGRYVAVFEALVGSPFITRVSIINTRTGRQKFQSTYGGLGWIFWSGEKDILNLLILDNSPLSRWGYLIQGAVRWVRLMPEGRVISATALRSVIALEAFDAGQAVLAFQEGDQDRVVRLEGTSGRAIETVRVPADRAVRGAQISGVDTGRPAALVLFYNLPRAWVVDDVSAHEVEAPLSGGKNAYCLFGETSDSNEGVQTVLRRKVGPPSSAEGKPLAGNFLLPWNSSWILPPGVSPPSLFFGANSSSGEVLWVRSGPAGRWERLWEIAPMIFYEDQGGTRVRGMRSFAIDFGSGDGAFLVKEGATRRLDVYDPRSGVIRGPEACSPGEKASLRAGPIPGLNGILIHLICGTPPERNVHFVHRSGSQKISELTGVRVGSVPLWLDAEGRGVWQSQGGKIWRSSSEGGEIPLWPLGTDRR